MTDAAKSGELLTLKLRYQPPTGGASTLLTFPVKDSGAKFGSSSPDFQFAAAVASFGMLLRNSKFKGETTYGAVLETAAAAKGEDKHGLRAEFLTLVTAAQQLAGPQTGAAPPPAPQSPRTGAWLPPGTAPRPVVYQPAQPASAVFAAASRGFLPLEPGELFILGIAAGTVLSLVVLLVSLGLVWLRSAAPALVLTPKPWGKEIGW